MELTKTKLVEQEVVIGHECDMCREIVDGDDSVFRQGFYSLKYVTNYPWESKVEYLDVCCTKCYMSAFKYALEDVDAKYYCTIDNMPYDFALEFYNHIKAKGDE